MADDAPGRGGEPARYALPEFTRSLRGFASVAGLQAPSHNLVFGPLLTARRSAMRVQAPESRAAAFDAERLRRALLDAVAAIAGERSAGDAPTGRALAARLEEAAAPALAALGALDARAREVKAAAPAVPAETWNAWCAAVQRVFDAADTFWLRIDDVAPPARRGPLRLGLPFVLAALAALHAAPAAAQHVTLRVTGASPDSLLRAGFDVVGAERGDVLVVASPGERLRLGALGFAATAMATARASALAGAQAAPVVYRPFDDAARGIRRWADSIVAANPRVSVDTIGRSYEGRPILAVKVGPRGDSPQRPNVLFLATYHAREWAATEMALRLVAWLAAPPGTDARRDSLVLARDIWIVPVANPDGYQYTFTTDRLWRKTRSPQGAAVGVDMNRNHSVNWGFDNEGSSPIPDSDIYRGPSPASEVETRAIEAFLAAHPPVTSVSYHTYAGLIMYPPGASYGPLPADLPVYRMLAGTNLRSAAADHLPGSIRTAYAPGPSWQLYTTN
ncbi:MAG: M14 family zinc carboxypeptidase, partial [Gemmatimonadota bacterium]|nr:M14 family zinc carboxypeptidase [Gemmatimonadota bacterium]